ncbi:uncharacterized protein METZ01_LOCUS440479, partial [marine metagenome]
CGPNRWCFGATRWCDSYQRKDLTNCCLCNPCQSDCYPRAWPGGISGRYCSVATL